MEKNMEPGKRKIFEIKLYRKTMSIKSFKERTY